MIYYIPIPSMYGIFTYVYHTNQPNVDKYTIHGSYGIDWSIFGSSSHEFPNAFRPLELRNSWGRNSFNSK